MKNSCSMQGFTILEMLVVLAIIALVMSFGALVIPRYGGRVATAGAAQAVAENLRRAQAQALYSHRASTLVVGKDGHSFSLGGNTNYLPTDVAIRLSSSPRIAFGPDGESDGGYIVIEGAHDIFTLEIDQITGSVTIIKTLK